MPVMLTVDDRTLLTCLEVNTAVVFWLLDLLCKYKDVYNVYVCVHICIYIKV